MLAVLVEKLLIGSDWRYLSLLSFQAAAADNTEIIANMATTNAPIIGFASPTYRGFVEVGHHLGVGPKFMASDSQWNQKLICAAQVHIITKDMMDEVTRDIHRLARKLI